MSFKSNEVVDALNNLKILGRECPLCKSNDWNLLERYFSLAPLEKEETLDQHPIEHGKAAVVLQCSECGFLAWINTKALGLRD